MLSGLVCNQTGSQAYLQRRVGGSWVSGAGAVQEAKKLWDSVEKCISTSGWLWIVFSLWLLEAMLRAPVRLLILTASVSCRARPCRPFPKDSAVPRLRDEGDCSNCGCMAVFALEST